MKYLLLAFVIIAVIAIVTPVSYFLGSCIGWLWIRMLDDIKDTIHRMRSDNK